jgi:hypothetical protein
VVTDAGSATTDALPPLDPGVPAVTVAAGPDEASDPASDAPLTVAAALALAEQGRLVVSVRSKSYEGTLRHLQELSRVAGRDTRWRAHELSDLPRELASLAVPMDDPSMVPAPALPGRSTPAAPVFASSGDHPTGPLMRTGPEPSDAGLSFPPPRLVVRTLRVVQMNSTEGSLDDLLKDLNISRDHEARFRALPPERAIPTDLSLDPEAVLWWARGPQGWAKRVSVPVVVETVE